MAKKITEYIRLGLTPDLLQRIRIEAKQQKVSVTELIRRATEESLIQLNRQRIKERYASCETSNRVNRRPN